MYRYGHFILASLFFLSLLLVFLTIPLGLRTPIVNLFSLETLYSTTSGRVLAFHSCEPITRGGKHEAPLGPDYHQRKAQ